MKLLSTIAYAMCVAALSAKKSKSKKKSSDDSKGYRMLAERDSPLYARGSTKNERILAEYKWASAKNMDLRDEIEVDDFDKDTWCAEPYKACWEDDKDLEDIIRVLKEALIRMETKSDSASFAGLAFRQMRGGGAGITDYGGAIFKTFKETTGIARVQREASKKYSKTAYKADLSEAACIKKYGKGSRYCNVRKTRVPKIYDIVENLSFEAKTAYGMLQDYQEDNDEDEDEDEE